MTFYNPPKTRFFQLLTSISLVMIGLTRTGTAGPAEDFQIAEITKELNDLRKSPSDPIKCSTIFHDINRINAIAGKKYFSDKEIQFFTAKCQAYKPSASKATESQPKQVPANKKATPNRQPLPKASESDDMFTRVTSALQTLKEKPANKKNCEDRVELIATYDKIATIDGKKSYSIEERNYFLKDCFALVPEAKQPLTHATPKPSVPGGFMNELKAKMQQHQEDLSRKEALDSLDDLLEELATDKKGS